MAGELRIYGGQAKFRAALDRHLTTGRELIDMLEGVKRRIDAEGKGPTGLHAELLGSEWIREVEQWQIRTTRAVLRHLQDGAQDRLPTLGIRWPPDTGKPRHIRSIDWVEPWLQESVDELQRLRDSLNGAARDRVDRGSAAPAEPIDRVARVRALLAVGETPTVEFKSTLTWSIHGAVVDRALPKMVTKTIAALANTNGGTLLIGVGPDGGVLGLEPDCAALRRGDDTCIDAFSRSLAGVLGLHLGAAIAAEIATDYLEFDGQLVCVVDVAQYDRAVYLKTGDQEEFFVRSGTTSIALPMSEAHAYLRRRLTT
jgi:hypothetical protein